MTVNDRPTDAIAIAQARRASHPRLRVTTNDERRTQRERAERVVRAQASVERVVGFSFSVSLQIQFSAAVEPERTHFMISRFVASPFFDSFSSYVHETVVQVAVRVPFFCQFFQTTHRNDCVRKCACANRISPRRVFTSCVKSSRMHCCQTIFQGKVKMSLNNSSRISVSASTLAE